MAQINQIDHWETKGIQICWPESEWDGKICSLSITNSILNSIELANSEETPGLVFYPGCMDLFADFGMPGNEHREHPTKASEAAIAGGFTRILLSSDGQPFPDEGASINALKNISTNVPITLNFSGGISQKGEGKELAELFDMFQTGSIAFIEPYQHFLSSSLLLKALLYSKSFGGLVVNQSGDPSLSQTGSIHEGTVSVSLGLKGTPAIAEELGIERDVRLAQYAQTPILLHKISSKEGVEALKRAKDAQRSVFATVSINNLIFTDENLTDFDSHYKVWPPLRSNNDRLALIEAVNEGLIDIIVSDHKPFDPESKNVEFEYAKFGVTGLQTMVSAWNTYLKNQISPNAFIQAVAMNPRKLFKIESPIIEKGKSIEAFVFDANAAWTLNENTNFSLSKQSPLWSKEIKGKTRVSIGKTMNQIV